MITSALRSQLKTLQQQRQKGRALYAATGDIEHAVIPDAQKQTIRQSIDALKELRFSDMVMSQINNQHIYHYHQIAQLARHLCQLTPVKDWSVKVGGKRNNHGLVVTGHYGPATPAIVFEFNGQGFVPKQFSYSLQISTSVLH